MKASVLLAIIAVVVVLDVVVYFHITSVRGEDKPVSVRVHSRMDNEGKERQEERVKSGRYKDREVKPRDEDMDVLRFYDRASGYKMYHGVFGL